MSDKYKISLQLGIVKWYSTFMFKRYYGEYVIVGKENVPTNEPVIFAPNHLNALMDALAVHSIVPQSMPVTFLARSDIFKNKFAAKVMNFVRIMPAFRMRDGVENLSKNKDVFERCVDILHHNDGLGIMPEGNQGEERRLRSLVKGIFRIAFAAQQKYGTQPGVKIVPIGIDYGHLEKYGKHVLICVGKPIEVSEYMDRFAENSVAATNEIRERLRKELVAISLDLASDNHYACFETAVEIACTAMVEKMKLPEGTAFRFIARQRIARNLLEIEQTDPDKMTQLSHQCKRYRLLVKKIKLRTSNIDKPISSAYSMVPDLILLLCLFPFFVIGFVTNILPFGLPVIIRKAMKVEYSGFFSSIQFTLGALLFPLFYIVNVVLLASFLDTTWWLVALFAVSQYGFGKLAYWWYGTFKAFVADVRYRILFRCGSSKLKELIHLQNTIVEHVI